MRRLHVIGIGAGDPEYVTMQALRAMNDTDVFFLVDKGADKASLVDLRTEILDRYVTRPFTVVEIADPPRDRGAEGYTEAVAHWHEARAERFESALLEHLGEDGAGAFLVWGDPALYDSTLRVIDRILARGQAAFEYDVIPGITAVQALVAQHRVPLNGIGEPIHITTGRRMASGFPEDLDSAVVMLDGGFAPLSWTDESLHIYWGAYVGTPDQVLRSGRLVDVAGEIARTKRELRAHHGWIMDTYLLRRE